MSEVLATYRRDIKFDLDFDIPYVPEYAGYIMQDMFVRVQGWYDPENYTRPDNNEVFGVLIDIENGEGRMSSDASMTLKEVQDSQDDKDQKEKDYFVKYFQHKGEPFHRASYDSFRKGMYLLVIPTEKNVGDPGVTPEDIKNEQIETIKEYINTMREEWEKLWEHVNNLKGEYKSEFDEFHKKLEADEPHGKWELYRSFVTNTINGEKTDVFRYKTFLEWLTEQDDLLSDEETLGTALKKMCAPFLENATYKISTDWAIPYIIFYPWHARGELKYSKSAPDSPDYYYPFNSFLGHFSNHDEIKIPKGTMFTSLKLTPTGCSLLAVAAQLITNIIFLSTESMKALDEYNGYAAKLQIINQMLLGGPPLENGPLKKYSEAELFKAIEEAEKRYGKEKWENDMRDGLFKQNVKDKSDPAHLDQLLLGVNDIFKLQAFFQSVVEKECTERDGINERRIGALEHCYAQLFKLVTHPTWNHAEEELWMWNTDDYGTMLYVSMAHLLLAQSPQSLNIYQEKHRDLIFESELFEISREEWEKKEWAAKGTSHITDNWYIAFPGLIATLFQAQYANYADEVISKAGNDFAEAAKQLRRPYKKILKHFIPSLERKFDVLDLEIENLSQKIQELDGIQELKNGTLSEQRRINLKRQVRQTVDATMTKVDAEIIQMKASIKAQKICGGLSILLNMYALVSFGLYKGLADEEGDLSNWKLTEFTGIGAQLIGLTDDVLSFSRVTGVLKVIEGTRMAATLKIISKTAAWIGVIQSSIQAISNIADEDWKNFWLNSAAVVGGLMVIGGGFVRSGVLVASSGIGAKIGVILIIIGTVTLILSGLLQFFSVFENKAEKYCRHLLISKWDEGGCEKFKKYKEDFEFKAHHTFRGLKYDKSVFGNDVSKIDELVERVINFIYDYDTYDYYGFKLG
ncbi:MAG: hypothetical protein JXR70_09650 [Spirochaetales bacterium]|nr:hypothetical protein [Spirochaetales bacterium]